MKSIGFRFWASIAAIVIICGGVMGCQNDPDTNNMEPQYYASFLEESAVSISANGVVVKSFDLESEQIVHNDDKTLYMVSDMNYTTQYTLSIIGDLLLDNIVTVDYKSSGIDGFSSNMIEMSVAKIETSDKCYWLWSSSECIGFIIKFYL